MSQAIKESEVERWWVKGFNMPRQVSVEPNDRGDGWVWAKSVGDVPTRELFDTEKLAIDVARKLRIDEMGRLQDEVNALDERYDDLEDAEMKAEGL